MSDLISRQAVLDLFAEKCDAVRPYHEVWQAVIMLPSVETEIEKCDDCISRKDMLKKINNLCNNTCEYSKIQRKSMCDACNLDLVFDMINNAKAVEPERKPGKWLPHMVNEKCESIDRDVCSECHVCFYGEPTWSWKYCPNCGKPMEVQDEIRDQ